MCVRHTLASADLCFPVHLSLAVARRRCRGCEQPSSAQPGRSLLSSLLLDGAVVSTAWRRSAGVGVRRASICRAGTVTPVHGQYLVPAPPARSAGSADSGAAFSPRRLQQVAMLEWGGEPVAMAHGLPLVTARLQSTLGSQIADGLLLKSCP